MAPILKQKFEDILLASKLISPAQLDLIKIESSKSGKPIDEIIGELKLLKDEDLIRLKAQAAGLPYVDLTGKTIPQEILKKIPYNYARDYSAAAFALADDELSVAMVDPANLRVVDFLEKRIGIKIKTFMASPVSVKHALSQYQKVAALEVSEVLKTVDIEEERTELKDIKDAQALIVDAPVTKAVNSILEFAVKAHASDIHIEPKEKTVRVRYRIDGILHEVMEIPKHIQPAIVSRIKILSNLKIDEHRIPQDGQFAIRFSGREIDVRVAISPQVQGEKVVMRLLDRGGGSITLDSLGLHGRAYEIVRLGAQRPHGMTLVTGPTGSGKTTTLNSVLKELNKEDVNIITIEDPVEYKVEGVNQIQVNNQVGLTFANALRSVLRQDPNIIMVGEIRDQETAELAVHAALTGHVVLSTLHTNNAAGILPRLLDMNIEPYLIASTVATGIGQRLVRQICPHCKAPYTASPAAVELINKHVGTLLSRKDLGYPNLPKRSSNRYTLHRGKGCDECAHTGYLGRIALFEVFPMTSEIESLLLTQPTTQQVEDLAVKQGMVTMQQDGYLKALAGFTTLDEVARVTTD